MSDLRTAAQQALEVLELEMGTRRCKVAIAALRAALAQQDQQAPESTYHPCTFILIKGLKKLKAWGVLAEWDKAREIVDKRLRAAPPQQVKLDDSERRCGRPGCDMTCCQPLAQQAEPVQEPYTGDVTRIMRDAGMTFHLGPPHKAVVEQMTRGVDLVYAEASIKTAQQFSAALAQQAKPVWMHPWPPVRAQQAEPVSADPHTTTLRNLLKFCLPWEPDACVLGNVTARQAVTALRSALAQQDEPLNLADPAVRKRLATQWGYVPAAQAEPVEPVAWKQGSLVTFNEDPYPALGGLFVQFWDGEEVAARVYANDLKTLRQRCAKVNTAPPQRKPLTEEEIVDAVREADLDWQKGWTLDETQSNRFVTLARAVERAHGIKE